MTRRLFAADADTVSIITTALEHLGDDAETCAAELDTSDPDTAEIHRTVASKTRAIIESIAARDVSDPRGVLYVTPNRDVYVLDDSEGESSTTSTTRPSYTVWHFDGRVSTAQDLPADAACISPPFG